VMLHVLGLAVGAGAAAAAVPLAGWDYDSPEGLLTLGGGTLAGYLVGHLLATHILNRQVRRLWQAITGDEGAGLPGAAGAAEA